MKQIAQVAKARRLVSLAVALPLAFGMVGALGSTADAFTISGRVTNTYTTSLGVAGNGVGGVRIIAINRAQDPTDTVADFAETVTKPANDTTPADDPTVGTYTLTGLPNGNYFVFASNDSPPRRIYRQPNTGKNPVPVRNAAGAIPTRTINFRAFNTDDTRPPSATLTLTNPASGSSGSPIAPPTSISGTAKDQGDATATGENFRAGIGQIVVAIGGNIQPLFPFPGAPEAPTELFNFVTRTWETVDPLAIPDSGGITPANASLARFLLPVNQTFNDAGTWSVDLKDDAGNPLTDADGNPLFEAGQRYVIGYGAIDKAGNARGRSTTFTIQGGTP